MPLWAETLRVATYNAELARRGPGVLLRDILKDNDPQIAAVMDAIVQTNPDVLALQGFDYDYENRALLAFAEDLAARGSPYPYVFAAPPNAGRMTDHDLDKNGTKGEARDAQGFGRFFGEGAMALLSRHPIAVSEAQSFADLLWRDLPDNLYPMVADAPWNGAEAYKIQRLSAHGHWVVPIDHPTFGRLNILTYHATPPVFDGPEDRNGRRNHDETAFWSHFLDGHFGPAPKERFILMGDANADPERGDGRPDAIRALLADLRLQDPLPDTPTVLWPETGPMRVDYILPSADWRIRGAGVQPRNETASRHSLVWVDLTQ